MPIRRLFCGIIGALLAAAAAPAGGKLEVSTAGGASGPCSATLPDGRSFITGGGDTPLATTEYFALKDSTLPAASMIEPRRSHICVGLPDNTVLVAGGVGQANRPTNSAEIFHTDTGQWTLTGAMLAARTGASALLLADGRVLVIGGQIGGQPADTLEIYDRARGRFEPVAGILSAPRKGHAVAVLEDGRVLVAGGTGPGGVVLDTTDLFDPRMGGILPGPRMAAPRTNFPATRLLDGKILLAGGSNGAGELVSAEIFDPETGAFSPTAPLRAARQGHIAVVILGNGRVLVAGGFSAGQPVQDGEYFIPWRGAFEPAAPNPAGRGSEVVMVGRLNGTGKLMSTGAYASPTIGFVKGAGEPAEAAAVAGAGWEPGEEVRIHVRRNPSQAGEVEATAVADGSGRIAASIPRDREDPGGILYIFARSTRSEAGARYSSRNVH